jgi:putative FmdB family regulatory protein
MPIYDYKCQNCGTIQSDIYTQISDKTRVCPRCSHEDFVGIMERVWLPGQGASVIGDEIDIEIKHGLCNADGTPRRFRSREELRRAERKAGLTNYVVHTDGDKHVKRWV